MFRSEEDIDQISSQHYPLLIQNQYSDISQNNRRTDVEIQNKIEDNSQNAQNGPCILNQSDIDKQNFDQIEHTDIKNENRTDTIGLQNNDEKMQSRNGLNSPPDGTDLDNR